MWVAVDWGAGGECYWESAGWGSALERNLGGRSGLTGGENASSESVGWFCKYIRQKILPFGTTAGTQCTIPLGFTPLNIIIHM